MPANPKSRVGHFERIVPLGYKESIEQNKNVVDNPCLHRLYDDIRAVVTGPLISKQRAKAMIKLNTGYSDKKYIQCVRNGGIL